MRGIGAGDAASLRRPQRRAVPAVEACRQGHRSGRRVHRRRQGSTDRGHIDMARARAGGARRRSVRHLRLLRPFRHRQARRQTAAIRRRSRRRPNASSRSTSRLPSWRCAYQDRARRRLEDLPQHGRHRGRHVGGQVRRRAAHGRLRGDRRRSRRARNLPRRRAALARPGLEPAATSSATACPSPIRRAPTPGLA